MLLKNRRLKNYLLFPRIQLTMLCSGLLVSALSFAILWYKISDTFIYLINVGKQLQFKPESGYFKLLHTQQELIFKNLLLVAGVGCALSGIFLLIISHKIVGPIYRMNLFFKELRSAQEEGRSLPVLKFRRGDYFAELAETVNQAVKAERSKIDKKQ